MSVTRVGVTGPSAAYLGFVAKGPGGGGSGPGLQVGVTRFGVCGPSAAYLGFVAKGESAPVGPGYLRVHDLGTVIFTQVVTKIARTD